MARAILNKSSSLIHRRTISNVAVHQPLVSFQEKRLGPHNTMPSASR
jgi:hypothetical protein